MKEVVNDTFSVFGMVFVVLIGASYFVPIGEIIDNARLFLIIFFIVSIVGRYLLKRKKEKTNN
ncbi:MULTISPECIES: hypothetical protein [Listeria]|uniref:hypothetical protein n=1 Tax=Listeria TaxID=1637 RepID=UPI0016257B82|nr:MULTISPECIES: hypothetical protein [Listeria]MBC1814093.1 hypothetical protein [Listeria booriae]MBC1817138.1 hypothetical protein [Listeria seeligeri]MBC2019394.1 hypothetical protein [Listeria seeligeri]MBC2233018.1 hypothetical protein [Listeria seeligeri]MBF2626152.1 hypothetical protein [Listeria seeligeri]